MASVNIPRDTLDPCYRYKRPMAILEPLGKQKMLLVNTSKLCKSLGVSPSDLTRWFAKKAGMSVRFPSSAVITFASCDVSVGDVEDWIEEFVAFFVLCPVCSNPEAGAPATKAKRKCLACGWHDK